MSRRRHKAAITTDSRDRPMPRAPRPPLTRLLSAHALTIICIAAVCIAVLIVHWPALSAQATVFDDELYIAKNPYIVNPSLHSAWRIVSEVWHPSTSRGYYHPMAMLSLMFDVARGGHMRSLTPFHQTNLLLHLVSTAMVILILLHVTREPLTPAALGLLFGVHPLTVEPVVWIAARKALLAGTFSLAAIALYLRYTQRPRRLTYAASLIAFVLAALSKPTSLPLPVVLLILDFWPLRRWSSKTLAEKVPFFATALLFGLTAVISHSETASLAAPTNDSIVGLIGAAGMKFLFMPLKMLCASDPTPFVPAPLPMDRTDWLVTTAIFSSSIVVIRLLYRISLARAFLSGAAIYAILVLPLLGFFRYGDAWVYYFDNYLYLPMIGPLLAVAGFAVWIRRIRRPAAATSTDGSIAALHAVEGPAGGVLTKGPSQIGRIRLVLPPAIFVILAIPLANDARAYLAEWSDSIRLHRYMLSLAPGNPMITGSLGNVLADERHYEEAVPVLERAVKLDETDPHLWNNLGRVLMATGKYDDAAAALNKALSLKRNYADSHANLGRVLAKQKRGDEAIAHFDAALQAEPDSPLTHANYADVLIELGRIDEAARHAARAAALNPQDADVQASQGLAAIRQGRFSDAAEYYGAALQFRPDFADAHAGLGLALGRLDRLDDAIKHLQEAVRLNPSDAESHNNLGIVFAQRHKLDDAIAQFEEALRLKPDYPDAARNLAVARRDREARAPAR